MSKLIVDGDTGEPIGELLDGDRIIRGHIVEELPEENDRMPFSNGEWGKTYDIALGKLARLNLIAVDYKMILLFLTLVMYGSGLIIHGNYKPVKIEWLESELQISHNTAVKTLKRLAEFRIISESYSGKEKNIFLQPLYLPKGQIHK